jgi:hypothetical protein
LWIFYPFFPYSSIGRSPEICPPLEISGGKKYPFPVNLRTFPEKSTGTISSSALLAIFRLIPCNMAQNGLFTFPDRKISVPPDKIKDGDKTGLENRGYSRSGLVAAQSSTAQPLQSYERTASAANDTIGTAPPPRVKAQSSLTFGKTTFHNPAAAFAGDFSTLPASRYGCSATQTPDGSMSRAAAGSPPDGEIFACTPRTPPGWEK